MTQKQKTAWKTPELIVLVRSRPEEAVLAGCKSSAISGAGATITNCASFYYRNNGHPCVAGSCSSSTPS